MSHATDRGAIATANTLAALPAIRSAFWRRPLRRTLHILLITTMIQTCVYAPASPASADDGRTERVNITFFDCVANKTAPSDVRIVLSDKRGSPSSTITFPESTPATVRHVTIRVAPGQYGLVVANGDCADDLLLSVLPGLDRNVVALARSMAILTSNIGSVSGILPDKGWQVAIVFKNRRIGRNLSPDGFFQVPAVVDGKAYYATHLPLGMATLRLYNQALYRWIDFDVGSLTEAVPSLARSVTLQEVENAVPEVGGI